MNEDKKTRKAPAFQFYADDFLALTENDFQRVCNGMPPHSQRICQDKFQIDADGNYRNKRLEAEREKQDQYRKKQTDNAKKRWVGNATAYATAYATALPAHMPNVCSPSPSPSPNKEESIASEPQRSRFAPPTIKEVEDRCLEIGLPTSEASKFVNYYESKGWIVGRSKMKSWKASLAGWKDRHNERQQALPIQSQSRQALDQNIANYL